MARFKFVRTDKYEQMQRELKGYQDGMDNSDNEWWRIIARELKGINLPPWSPMSRDAVKNAFETNAPLHGIVCMIARSVGEVSKFLELYDRRTGDFVDGHWVSRLLANPNDRFTGTKLAEGWSVNKLLFSDAWMHAPMTVGRKREGKALYLIPSQTVEAVKGGIEKPLKGIMIAGHAGEIPIEDVITSFDYNLDPASFFGTSKVLAAAKYLSVIDLGMRRQDASLTNGGTANIITPAPNDMGIKPSDREDIERSANALKNANKNIVVKAPIQVHSLGSTPVDLSILDSHKEAVTALCFVYNIPIDLYYGQAKYENAREAKKTIYEQHAIPMAEEMANDVLSHFKLSDQYVFKVNTDRIAVLQPDPYDTAQKMNLAQCFSTNEMREAAGWERIDEAWADKVRMGMGTAFGDEMSASYDISEL